MLAKWGELVAYDYLEAQLKNLVRYRREPQE